MAVSSSEPLVSIVTPCFNSEQYLPTTAESILGQTWTSWEWLIVDDASSDGSLQIAEQLAAAEPRIKLLRQSSRSGPAHARNAGIAAARGSIITFIDSDDWWLPEFLSRSLAFMRDNKYPLVYSSYRIYDDRTGRYRRDFIVPERVGYEDVLRSCPISMLTALYRADQLGKFMLPDIPREDFGMWLDILKRVPYAHGMREALAVYRLRGSSRSRDKLRVARMQWQVYRRHEQLSIAKSLRCLVVWAVRGLVKYRGG